MPRDEGNENGRHDDRPAPPPTDDLVGRGDSAFRCLIDAFYDRVEGDDLLRPCSREV
jgi:hypothetical protein